jgi:hypothetical protein
VIRQLSVGLALVSVATLPVLAQSQPAVAASQAWSFAVSGDSRNCGDVVMPAIAGDALARHAEFYWHLGDLRKMSGVDEDIEHEAGNRGRSLTMAEYRERAWDDFIANQVVPFGSTPFFVGIGNHELIAPKTRDEFIAQFADWLGSPVLKEQRLADDPTDHRLKTYNHWVERGVDFINLDNASRDQFDAAQLAWFEALVRKDSADPSIKTLVVGMHQALPESISLGHSMNESPEGTESGRRVYADLLRARVGARKNVYILASHSHFFMDGTFNTEYWRAHGGTLPGWIVGTAGAVRYPLPDDAKNARAAETNVYGYLLATVAADATITFEFRHLTEKDVPSYVAKEFTPEFVHWCFEKNSEAPATPAIGSSTAEP